MWTGTMLGLARGLTSTSPGHARIRWIDYLILLNDLFSLRRWPIPH